MLVTALPHRSGGLRSTDGFSLTIRSAHLWATVLSMRGSLRQRGPKRWQLRVYEGRNEITGSKTYRTRTIEGTKRQAETALAAMVAEVEAGIVKPKAMTVADMLEAWLKHHRAPRPLAVDPLRLPAARPTASRRLQEHADRQGHAEAGRRPLRTPVTRRQAQAGDRDPLPRRPPRRLRPGRAVVVGRPQPGRTGNATPRPTPRDPSSGCRGGARRHRRRWQVTQSGERARLPPPRGDRLPTRRGVRTPMGRRRLRFRARHGDDPPWRRRRRGRADREGHQDARATPSRSRP